MIPHTKLIRYTLPAPKDASSVCVGIDLFSQAASHQVSSARMSLTTVFGMGTGGPSSLMTPTFHDRQTTAKCKYRYFNTERKKYQVIFCKILIRKTNKVSQYTLKTEQWKKRSKGEVVERSARSSPRPISTAKLNVSPRLHMQPINPVVYWGSYQITLWDILS